SSSIPFTSIRRSSAGRSIPARRQSTPRPVLLMPHWHSPATAPLACNRRILLPTGRWPMSGDYEVGYKKPPKATQFKKRQSRNRRGRPKGTKNLKTDLLEEMQEQIRVREGSREGKISKQRAMVKSLTAQAIKGNARATNVALGLLLRLTHTDTTTEPAVDL